MYEITIRTLSRTHKAEVEAEVESEALAIVQRLISERTTIGTTDGELVLFEPEHVVSLSYTPDDPMNLENA